MWQQEPGQIQSGLDANALAGVAPLYWGDNLVLSDDGENGLELNNSFRDGEERNALFFCPSTTASHANRGRFDCFPFLF